MRSRETGKMRDTVTYVNMLKPHSGLSFDTALRADFLSPDREFVLLPCFCDVHVHFREPGFSYKETIRTGSLAAARGGYTAVFAMPNLNPVPDSAEHLEAEMAIIRRDAAVPVMPYASITVGEKGERLADLEALAAAGAVAFSDDGRGVQSRAMMREAMVRAKALGKVIVAHCEDEAYPAEDPRSEWKEVERDLILADETGAAFHACHISSKESVDLIRDAKKSGVDATCETAPHYLALDDTMLEDDGRFKMNPPVRTKRDREALLEAVADGTVDMIATDHAPHSAEEKARGFAKSLNGIVGLETAFPVLYTDLVRGGIVTLGTLVRLLAENPRKRFGLPEDGGFAVWDLNAEYAVDPAEFLSMGKSCPFTGRRVFGRNKLTVLNGTAVFKEL
jgi:dihydroorotase